MNSFGYTGILRILSVISLIFLSFPICFVFFAKFWLLLKEILDVSRRQQVLQES